jgi:hypothetical protein
MLPDRVSSLPNGERLDLPATQTSFAAPPRLLSDSSGFVPRRSSVRRWATASWVTSTFAALTVLLLVVASATGDMRFLLGELAFTAASYLSLWILSDRPLLSPVQVVVFFFWWWFGVGPIAIASVDLVTRGTEAAAQTVGRGADSLWIVTLGLPLYASAASVVLRIVGHGDWGLKSLRPARRAYRVETLMKMLAVWLTSLAIVNLYQYTYGGGVTQVNFLGGTITNVWWVGALSALAGSMRTLVTATAIHMLFSHRAAKERVPLYLILTVTTLVLLTIYQALFAGWKADFVFLALMFIVNYLAVKQRPPMIQLLLLGVAYFAFIEPYVMLGRTLNQQIAGRETDVRREVFSQLLSSGEAFRANSKQSSEFTIKGIFRDLYPMAGEIARRSTATYGELEGETVTAAALALVPRALAPEKPDLNMGNVYSRTYAADMGMASSADMLNSMSPTVPFDIVANYGTIWGIISFGLLGAFWTLFCCALLTPARLNSHPFTPWLIIIAESYEAALIHLIALVRNIPIAVIAMIWIRKTNSRREL